MTRFFFSLLLLTAACSGGTDAPPPGASPDGGSDAPVGDAQPDAGDGLDCKGPAVRFKGDLSLGACHAGASASGNTREIYLPDGGTFRIYATGALAAGTTSPAYAVLRYKHKDKMETLVAGEGSTVTTPKGNEDPMSPFSFALKNVRRAGACDMAGTGTLNVDGNKLTGQLGTQTLSGEAFGMGHGKDDLFHYRFSLHGSEKGFALFLLDGQPYEGGPVNITHAIVAPRGSSPTFFCGTRGQVTRSGFGFTVRAKGLAEIDAAPSGTIEGTFGE